MSMYGYGYEEEEELFEEINNYLKLHTISELLTIVKDAVMYKEEEGR